MNILGLDPPSAIVDLSLFSALWTLEIPLAVKSWDVGIPRICFILATISNMSITLEMLTIIICDYVEDDNDSEAEYMPLLDVLLRSSRSRSGIYESPIAQYILFDFRYPNTYHNPNFHLIYSQDYHSYWKESASPLVQRDFSKLSQENNVSGSNTNCRRKIFAESSWTCHLRNYRQYIICLCITFEAEPPGLYVQARHSILGPLPS